MKANNDGSNNDAVLDDEAQDGPEIKTEDG